MRRLLRTSSTTLAALAVAAGAWLLVRPPANVAPPAATTDRFAAVVEPALDHCRRAAQLNFDVSWASACMQQADRHAACMRERSLTEPLAMASERCAQLHGEPDGFTDCTLPNERAAVLNAAYDRADGQCLAEATPRSRS